jgi:acetyl/propionyl-CoA carboxylase alpha subunit
VLRVPSGIGIRDDSGVYEGFEVSTFYDPILSKLVAWGSTRDEAIGRMLRALREYVIVGPTANVAFHRWALAHPAFRAGEIDTGFIARHWRPGVTAEGAIGAHRHGVRPQRRRVHRPAAIAMAGDRPPGGAA